MDNINPEHYKTQSIECIEITQHYNFCVGNAIKYLWRCESKGNKLEDLKKAQWYINKELDRMFDLEITSIWIDVKELTLNEHKHKLNFPDNIYNCIYEFYGHYTKSNLNNCLRFIQKEIDLCNESS